MNLSKNNAIPDEIDAMTAYMLMSMLLASVLMDIADDLGIVRPNANDMLMFDYISGSKYLFTINKKETSPAKMHTDTKRFCNYIKKNLYTSGQYVKYDVEMYEHDTNYFILVKCLLQKTI